MDNEIHVPYKRPIERINDKLYVIYAVYPIERCRDVPTIKQWLGCDMHLKLTLKVNIGFVMKSKILNGNMFNQEIILTKNECKSIIEMNNGFTQSKLGTDKSGYVSNVRTSSESIVNVSEEIKSMLLPKLSKYGVTNLPNTFSILKYKIGQEFKKHRDIEQIHPYKQTI